MMMLSLVMYQTSIDAMTGLFDLRQPQGKIAINLSWSKQRAFQILENDSKSRYSLLHRVEILFEKDFIVYLEERS